MNKMDEQFSARIEELLNHAEGGTVFFFKGFALPQIKQLLEHPHALLKAPELIETGNLDLPALNEKWLELAEAFRSGLESIEPIQKESAISLGMNHRQTFQYVILPQAISVSVPAFVANVIFLLKETSVFSAISLMDLMFTAKDLIGLYYKTTESLFLLVVFYLIILLPVSILGTLLERRVRYAGFGD